MILTFAAMDSLRGVVLAPDPLSFATVSNVCLTWIAAGLGLTFVGLLGFVFWRRRSAEKKKRELCEGMRLFVAGLKEISRGNLQPSLDKITHPILQDAVQAIREMGGNLQSEFQNAVSSGAAFRNLVESVPLALMKWSSRGEVLFVNRATAALWGFPEGVELDSPKSIYELFSHREEVRRLLNQVGESGAVRDFELTAQRKDGTPRWVSACVATLKDEQNHLDSFAGIFRDIHEHRQVEAEWIQMEKLESVTNFASTIAHDFNNILCGILPNVEMLRRQLAHPRRGGLEPGEDLHFLDSIDRSAQRALTLAKQLLSFARQPAGPLAVVNINHTLLEELHSLQQSLGSEIKIETDLAPGLWNTQADPAQLAEMLIHLAKYAQQMMRGRGVFRVETRNAVLDSTASMHYSGLMPGQYVTLTISDSSGDMGGIDGSRIFEPFLNLGELGANTGLGLSMVLRIVKNHKGHISVRNDAGKNTTFTIFFPRTEKEIDTGAPCSNPVLRRKGRILVVDDEDIVRDAASSLLTELGYEVDSVRDGDEALLRFHHKQAYDLVLLDLQMPRLDGYETLTRLRELDPDVKVILTSGFSPQGKTQDLMHSNQCGFLQKPYRLNDISKVVHNFLGRTL